MKTANAFLCFFIGCLSISSATAAPFIKTSWGPNQWRHFVAIDDALRASALDTIDTGAGSVELRPSARPDPSTVQVDDDAARQVDPQVSRQIDPQATRRAAGAVIDRDATIERVPGGPSADVLTSIWAPKTSIPAVRGVDAMVAAGRNYMIVSQQGEVQFLDKTGKALPTKNGIASNVAARDIFGAFLDLGGTFDINKHAGFPMACDSTSYPETSGTRYCINEVYDLRSHFDAGADRFVLLAQLRNPLWTDSYSEGMSKYTDEHGVCGVYKDKNGDTQPMPDADHCQLTRRLMVFAVSKTEDPRDGFHIYAVTENNYRDWPWASVNPEGGILLLGSRGLEHDTGPALTVISLVDLRAGSASPRYYKLYPDQLGSASRRVAPVVLHGTSALGGRSLAATWAANNKLRLFSFPGPTGQGSGGSFTEATVTLPGDVVLPGWMGAAAYRGGHFHLTWSAPVSPVARHSAWNLRVPLPLANGNLSGNSQVTSSTPGFRYAAVSKDKLSHAAWDDQASAIAVNNKGDVLTAYVRRDEDTGLEPGYVIWNVNDPGREDTVEIPFDVNVKPATNAEQGKMDFNWAVVDPVDDKTFWFAAKFKASGDNTVLVRVPQ